MKRKRRSTKTRKPIPRTAGGNLKLMGQRWGKYLKGKLT